MIAGMRVGARGRGVLAVMLPALAALALCVLAPLRQTSGDTVAGRMGGAVLRCGGGFDLSHVDWIRQLTDRKHVLYYFQPDELGEYGSIFGPAPAVIAAIALLDFGPGETLDDTTLRQRERAAAAVLIAIAVALLVLAARARCGLLPSVLTGGVAALSFAGAATLGQGLWQATVALPLLVGALATLAWRARHPRLQLITPALLLLAVMIRPTIAPLALGLGLVWALPTRDWRTWLAAAGIALVAVAPIVAWNIHHLWSPFPLGQWNGNERLTQSQFDLSPKHLALGVSGLLVSPARGLLWFAPIALVGIAHAWRTRDLRLFAVGCTLQLLVMAAFFKWHGGLAYGPRLMAEASWIGIWLALGAGRRIRLVSWIAVAITVLVGQLGLWSFEPSQWESRRAPEKHPAAFWDFVDSPISAALTSADGPATVDSPPTRALHCEGGNLESVH